MAAIKPDFSERGHRAKGLTIFLLFVDLHHAGLSPSAVDMKFDATRSILAHPVQSAGPFAFPIFGGHLLPIGR